MKKILILLTSIITTIVSFAQNYSISGRVTDYNGVPVDSCSVIIYNPDFSEALETLSDSNGYYRLGSVPKGRYAAIAAMRVNEYNTPRFSDRHNYGGMTRNRYICKKEENQNGKTI